MVRGLYQIPEGSVSADLLGDDHEPHRVKLAKKLQVTAHVFFNFWADLTGACATVDSYLAL
jgi:hypothetical protein